MSEMWENEQHPAQAEVHEPIVTDEDLWSHEMSDEPEQPDEEEEPYKERYKDVEVEKMVIGLGTIEVYGKQLDGTRVWLLLHTKGYIPVKFLTANDYDED